MHYVRHTVAIFRAYWGLRVGVINLEFNLGFHPAATFLAMKRRWPHRLSLRLYYECWLASLLFGMHAGMVLSFGV